MPDWRPTSFWITGAVVLLTLCSVPSLASDAPAQGHLDWGFDLSLVTASGHPSWLEGSGGKLRFDPDHDGPLFSRAYLDVEHRFASTVAGHILAEVYNDGHGPLVDLTEAYLDWRPMTTTATRYRIKVGAFYPRISLENVGPGWASPYSVSPSAINTWVGEELRSVGAEFSLSRRLQSLGNKHTFSMHIAIFEGNDPAGGLMAWKGWSIHDRQSRFSDEIPLPPIPRIQPGQWWDEQDPFITPLLEIDEEPGYYVNFEWRYGKRFLLRAMHYDNRADPEGLEDNQFAWWTYFDHVAFQAMLPGDIGLLAQWMDGFTAWGRFRNGVYSVDNKFRSNYVLLTRAFDRHRLTARYDHFKVTEADRTPLDENSENGHAWTLAYSLEATDNLTLAAEWLEIYTNRPAWIYFDLEPSRKERQAQVTLRFRFGR